MGLFTHLRRYIPITRQLRFLSTHLSAIPNEYPPPREVPEENEVSPIIRALKTAYQPPTREIIQKIQNMPPPHMYDVTDYFAFLNHFIASIHKSQRLGEFKGFLDNLEMTWLQSFKYLQEGKLYYLLKDIARKDFQFYLSNFNLEFQRDCFNAIAHISILSESAIKLSENLRKTPLFTENEYEKLSSLLTHYGVAKYRRTANYSFEKDRYQQFMLLIEEMKNQSMKPTVNICLDAIESLFHINANRGDLIIPVMRAVLGEHPQLAKHSRFIVLSSRISSRLNVVEATKKLHAQGCPVNGETIGHLMEGVLYGCYMQVGRYNNYVPTKTDLEQVYNMVTNELLPYLTQKNIDLFFRAAYSTDATTLALKFYLIIRNAGYFPGKEGFKHMLLLYARQRNMSNRILSLWEDISEFYHNCPPHWSYESLVTALCISKGKEGASLFNRILKEALNRDGEDVAPSASHWAWSSDMCVAKFKGYSWAKCYNGIYRLLHEMKNLKIPLTPSLVAASFLPNYNKVMFLKNYFPKLLEVLFDSSTPLCVSSLRNGILHGLFRNQHTSQAVFKISKEINILGVNIESTYDKEGEKNKQKIINTAIANSITKFILEENYKRRVYQRDRIDIMQIYSVDFRKMFESTESND